MIIKIPVVVSQLKEGGFMARCEEIRATATGDSPDDAVRNLREAIDEMVKEYGQNEVFQDLMPESQVQVIEVAV
jgi:predicted RNase H-like HicB family nuclease